MEHYPTQLNYPDTELTTHFTIQVMPIARLSSGKYKFGKSLLWSGQCLKTHEFLPRKPSSVLTDSAILADTSANAQADNWWEGKQHHFPAHVRYYFPARNAARCWPLPVETLNHILFDQNAFLSIHVQCFSIQIRMVVDWLGCLTFFPKSDS